jgi:7-carboxy-7-deazaguanine synthase
LQIKDDPRVISGERLPVMEDFYTIQGEGHHTGKPAYFIRIGGCDNACHWCDVKASWFEAMFPLLSVDELLKRTLAHPSRSVVVTGGEPLIYNLDLLCRTFRKQGIRLFLETSGSDKLSGEWDWICLSPKKDIPVKPELFQNASELKVVVLDETYFSFAEELARQVPATTLLYLQPEWSLRSKSLPLTIEYVKNNPRWMISLQSHKYMEIP